MEYVKQAVLHLRQDKDSEVRAMLNTTTQFIAGGLQLASAVWKQDLSGVMKAIGGIKTAAFDYAASQPKPWYVDLRDSDVTASRGCCFCEANTLLSLIVVPVVVRTVCCRCCDVRYDTVRVLAELPESRLIAAVETKAGTPQPPLVTFFVVELLDAIARRRNELEGSSDDGSNSNSNQGADLQAAESSEGSEETGTGRACRVAMSMLSRINCAPARLAQPTSCSVFVLSLVSRDVPSGYFTFADDHDDQSISVSARSSCWERCTRARRRCMTWTTTATTYGPTS